MKHIVILEGANIVVDVPFFENHRAKAVGARWHPSSKSWRVKPSKMTVAVINANFKPEEIDPRLQDLIGTTITIPALELNPQAVVKDIVLNKTQLRVINKAWNHYGFAIFHVMGNGKTLSTVALANLRRAYGLIDRLLIICPTSVKGVWPKEFDRYSAQPTVVKVFESGDKEPTWNKDEFPVLVVGVEALSQGGAFDVAHRFVNNGSTMTVVDESSRIKTYNAGRTERCWELAEESLFRTILTGTNVTQGIQDLYAQMRFVDPTIIGEISFFGFRNKYCIMGGFEQRKIVGYNNVDQLLERIAPYCDIVRKKDMDLPPKSYAVRDIKATPAQVKACKEIVRDMRTELGDFTISVQNALEGLLRLQQIAGGHYPDGTRLDGKNPKLAELVELLDEFEGKAIIWARYLPELTLITDALEEVYPGSTLTMSGAIKPEDRQPMVDQFQGDPRKRFFIANQATGGIGLTLTAATLCIYYSNTFSAEDRLQSEDRAHRIGQTNQVDYIDLISDLKVDQMVLKALSHKISLGAMVNEGLRASDLI